MGCATFRIMYFTNNVFLDQLFYFAWRSAAGEDVEIETYAAVGCW